MKTEIEKLDPSQCLGYHIINDDGKVWITKYPENCPAMNDVKYNASIPDARIDHLSFDCFGYHHVWADTIEELINDIKSLNVPYYSEDIFLNRIIKRDKSDTRDDRQIELYWDGRGTKITRGKITLNNMTAYTSL